MGPGAPLQARPIDMGLPSGLQWASCNIGAERPSDFGLWFSWGNIEGHGNGEGYDFSPAVYNTTPAAEIAADLSLSQDAAREYFGAPWRMPTEAEFMELYNNCTSVWTTLNGVPGRLFTSNVNGSTLFFPAAGFYRGKVPSGRGTAGIYWSTTYISTTNARSLNFSSSNVNPQYSGIRHLGLCVRAVYPQ